MDEDVLWVRLKPYNEKKGYKLKRYLAFGLRFDEPEGWYKVRKTITLTAAEGSRIVDLGAYLRSVRNDNDDPDSPLAFDVMTEAEAKQLDADERKAAELRAKATDARPMRSVGGDMTTADLNNNEAADDAADTAIARPAKRRPGRPRKNAA